MDWFLVNAFTLPRKPLSGNPAAVRFLPCDSSTVRELKQRYGDQPAELVKRLPWPDARHLQRVAHQYSQSETAFVINLVDPDTPTVAIRWMNGVSEIPLCGHATLGACAAIWSLATVPRDKPIRVWCAGGTVSVSYVSSMEAKPQSPSSDDDGWIAMSMPLTPVEKIDTPPDVVKCITDRSSIRVIQCFKCDFGIIVQLDSHQQLASLNVDKETLLVTGWRGIIATAKGAADGEYSTRFFAPSIGIDEDPATGSIHSALINVWQDSNTSDGNWTTFRQLSRRGGLIRVRREGAERVLVAGKGSIVIRGTVVQNTSTH